MVLTGLAVFALIAAVVTWDKQLPAPGQRIADLPKKRRIWTVLVFPVSLVVIAASALLAVEANRSAEGGANQLADFYGATIVFILGATCFAFVALLCLALWRVWPRRREPDRDV